MSPKYVKIFCTIKNECDLILDTYQFNKVSWKMMIQLITWTHLSNKHAEERGSVRLKNCQSARER
jgi:hypothetical protein